MYQVQKQQIWIISAIFYTQDEPANHFMIKVIM